MPHGSLAGKPAPGKMLVNISELLSAYYSAQIQKPVEFGTSGHRGSAINGSFNESHILAITQAICEYRKLNGITGPLFIGFDTHALSRPAFKTALEVLSANDVKVIVNEKDEYSPTPIISRMILEYNAGKKADFADGIVITPSHNGPQDGGFKYNPINGGPADTTITSWIEKRANEFIFDNNQGIKRLSYEKARAQAREIDFANQFIESLSQVIDLVAIREKKIRIGADPLGGSGINYWGRIAEKYDLDITVVNKTVDPTFSFMPLDSDNTIRMDCSSPYAMAGLIKLKDKFDISFGNDPDFDRHGIVTPDGLMNPNHYLAVAIWYLIQNRPNWSIELKVGKTLVSSSIIDKVVANLGRKLYEVPVGFKWFVEGLFNGWLAFGGEESAGASLLTKEGKVWTTDKDGFSLALLSAEIIAKTGQTPAEIYKNILVPQFGEPFYKRDDGLSADEKRKSLLKKFEPNKIIGSSVAGRKIIAALTKAPGNNAPMGGIKAILEDGSWFALRPSGTEPKMKFYIESFGGQKLWEKIHAEAPALIFG